MANYDDNFPVEIDLGRKMSDMGMDMPVAPRGTKDKSRKIYPKLYIDAVHGLEKLPEDGCVMIKYHRERLSVETPSDGEDKTGMTLEILRICMPEDMEDEDAPKDLASVMDGKMDDEESEDSPADETDEGE